MVSLNAFLLSKRTNKYPTFSLSLQTALGVETKYLRRLHHAEFLIGHFRAKSSNVKSVAAIKKESHA